MSLDDVTNLSLLLEWGIAARPRAGQLISGDLHLVQPCPNGVLVAVVDGLGHGPDAAAAARVAVATLEGYAHEPVSSLLQRCHGRLRATRGAVMSLAACNLLDGSMTWLGVGNVEGVVLRADLHTGPRYVSLVTRSGVVGSQLPPPRATTISFSRGDTLIFATDGIRSDFTHKLLPHYPPQHLANYLLVEYGRDTDDALVLVARYAGSAL